MIGKIETWFYELLYDNGILKKYSTPLFNSEKELNNKLISIFGDCDEIYFVKEECFDDLLLSGCLIL